MKYLLSIFLFISFSVKAQNTADLTHVSEYLKETEVELIQEREAVKEYL